MPRVTVLELAARFGMPDLAVSLARMALEDEAPGDLVLLSECAITGYVTPTMMFDPTRFAEPLESHTLEIYRRIAGDFQTHVAGPLVEAADGRFYNAMPVVAPSGKLVAHYRKRHPWMPETWATPGDFAYPSFSIDDTVFTLAVCFDVHFLEREAPATLDATDVLLFPSAWVDEDETDAREAIFARLVRRFGISIANANWGPGSPALPGQGGSRVVTKGRVHYASLSESRAWSRVDVDLGAKAR
ncbi:MAG: carbon-nitrogen hydrolase family protein [Myxococcales bacterium]|nr:carbon-nitrogen hydrolase family protein [Myxococcales bacterium]